MFKDEKKAFKEKEENKNSKKPPFEFNMKIIKKN